MKTDWYRKETWTKEDEQSFFEKLQRVRNRAMQAQYLKLQASALAYSKDVELMRTAESLLNYLLTEYSEEENRLYKSQALHTLGNVYKYRGNYQKALDYYKQAIDFESLFPNSISNSFMEYAELVVKTNRKELFQDVENTFSEERYESAILFPITKYLKYSILSIISKQKGDIERARYFAHLAEESAAMQQSGLNNHKTIGLVWKRDILLDKLMYE